MAKAAGDRMAACMANVQYFDLSNSESPQFIGRAVAALAADPKVMKKTGKVLVAAALGLEYGFTDVDGKQPRHVCRKPLSVEET